MIERKKIKYRLISHEEINHIARDAGFNKKEIISKYYSESAQKTTKMLMTKLNRPKKTIRDV